LTCDEDLHFDRALIPPMITQPFIENAIEHGQLHNVENGKISVRFFKYEGMLHVEIEDNGIGRKGAEKQNKASNHKSMAMQITKQRIENLNFKYKADGKLFVSDLDQVLQTGTKVLISLPYKQDISEIGQNEQVA
jgi:LytS/YehU family sensor histidine kinase